MSGSASGVRHDQINPILDGSMCEMISLSCGGKGVWVVKSVGGGRLRF